MTKAFKFQGNTVEQKFSELEHILPRLVRRLDPKVTTVIPPSVISSYIKESNGLLFKCSMFAGKIIRLSFHIGAAIKNAKEGRINIKCSIIGNGTEQSINIDTKKLSYISKIDLTMADGDLLVVSNNDPDVIFHDIAISLLFVSDYVDNSVRLIKEKII